ncbi:MAG TPA: hypothetical protein VMY76_11930, partial [Gemmatimonadales bacterium]|nr:hypothetical protein [Gemmatimonadales bacterium]
SYERVGRVRRQFRSGMTMLVECTAGDQSYEEISRSSCSLAIRPSPWETADFEFTPRARGDLRLEVKTLLPGWIIPVVLRVG